MDRSRILLAGAVVLLVTIAGVGGAAFNRWFTRYVEGDAFRQMLQKETAKSLHFDECVFDPIHRVGALGAMSEKANCSGGRKALTSLNTGAVSARFVPAGVLVRHWTIDDLHVERAQVGIQTYEPTPEPKPARPWYAIFLPDRAYLRKVWSDHADITWRMRGERAGIFDTRLVITPHGRDFNYQASAGTLRNPGLPDMRVQDIRLLITKELFTLHNLDLVSGESGTIHAEGTTATRGESKHVDFRMKWNDLPLRQWVSAARTAQISGQANGDLRWTGDDYRLRAAIMEGRVEIVHGRVGDLKILDEIATVTNHPDLRALSLSECRARYHWERSRIELKELTLEDARRFRIEGDIEVGANRSLGGKIELGIARAYLDWLPRAEEVFTRERDGYLWATVHLSGTLQSPQQDLSPRVMEVLQKSPGAFIGAALRAFDAWLQQK